MLPNTVQAVVLHLFILVFAGPLGIESRTKKAKPALTELLRQADALNINRNTLNIVCDVAKLKSPIVFNGIAGSRVAF